MLCRISKVVFTVSMLAACASQSQLADTKPELATPISSKPVEYLVDYSYPDSCVAVETAPILAEPQPVAPNIIWQRIRMGSQLDWDIDNQKIDAEFNWYQRHANYMARVSKRSARYIYYVTEQVEKRGLPTELALLPVVESAYDPFAYSHGRASGMWQFIPGTARVYKLEQNWWFDGRRDVIDSTDAALTYLEKLHSMFDGDWLLALAAYNSGEGTVGRAIKKNIKLGRPTDFWSLDLPRETRSYVPKLLSLAKLVNQPQEYGVELHPVPNAPYFAEVPTGSQIDLAEAAELADIEIEELYRLNPGLNRWATAPSGPHRLLVPIGKASAFEQKLGDLPPSARMNWQRYTVKPNDSIGLLAKRYNTDIATIRSANKLRSNMIKVGQSLVIPLAAQDSQHYALSAEQRLDTIQTKRKGASGSQQVFYTVKSGDNLWTIARRHGVTTSKLAHWNGMSPKDTLHLGQKLSVWTPQKVASTTPIAHRDTMTRKVGYKVRNGDSLARIASKFNVGIKDIVAWNSVNPSHYLQPGQKLTLYVDITAVN